MMPMKMNSGTAISMKLLIVPMKRFGRRLRSRIAMASGTATIRINAKSVDTPARVKATG